MIKSNLPILTATAFIICIFLFPLILYSQTAEADTISNNLEDVIVKGFGQNKKLKETPAAINYVDQTRLQLAAPTSIVTAINTTPGIRMEERSPGSYRINIRGSSLRSPFGVRNIKIYFNDIPVTDPGGQSYLNQLGYYNFASLEIIKGPGSSLYGAGTGGVFLIESLKANETPGFFTEYATGSYNLHNIYGSVTMGNADHTNKVGYQHQQSDGYRVHSALQRDVFSWTSNHSFSEGKQHLKTTFLYGDLFYETPGALTQSEYDANPRAARPGAGAFPGAEAAQASIHQKQFIAGASYDHQISSSIQNKTVLYGMFTDTRNPTIQNYAHAQEPHAGGRTTFKWKRAFNTSTLGIDAGGELQRGFATVNLFKNVNGKADSVRNNDEINNTQSLIFTQASFDHPSFSVTAGVSLNFLEIHFERFAPATLGKQDRKFTNQLAPRVAVLKKFKRFNVYASISKGFSPPTTAELVPTGAAANLDLNAEEGVNYDLGIKGTVLKRGTIDINGFLFALDNTIVQRRTAGGGDYFINAGKTKQHGIETMFTYPLFQSPTIMKHSMFWLSHTWHDFHYKDFKQVTADYSGNQLPSIAPHTISTGYDFTANNGILGTITYYYSDKIPLNDANSAYANAYSLLGLKAGYERIFKDKWRVKLFAGVDNLLDDQYSLGNDINGFGGRYFNAAAGRNYYAALVIQFMGRHDQ
jgi:iron complex outermembrane receptor protein